MWIFICVYIDLCVCGEERAGKIQMQQKLFASKNNQNDHVLTVLYYSYNCIKIRYKSSTDVQFSYTHQLFKQTSIEFADK